MAFVDSSLDLGDDEARAKFPYVYNVSFAVGYVGYNCRDDVMLVQYFLTKIWERSSVPPPAGAMTVDGWMGPITDRWIRTFQSGVTMNKPSPDAMVHDGIVDRALVGRYGSISGRTYTIIALNFSFYNRYPELYYFLPTAPDLPALLAYSLTKTEP